MRLCGLLLVILESTWSMHLTEPAYHVASINGTSGLYYERVSSLRLQHADWRVTVFIDVERFLRDFPTDERHIDETYGVCNKLSSPPSCNEILRINILRELFSRARGLTADLRKISENAKPGQEPTDMLPRTLSKRAAPFGIIGTLSKSLFGTLNEDDADYINSEIDKLFEDQADITHLVGQQMHIVHSNLQTLHEEHLIETHRMNAIQDALAKTREEVQRLDLDVVRARYNQSIINYSFQVERKVERYISTCEKYIRAIAAARAERA